MGNDQNEDKNQGLSENENRGKSGSEPLESSDKLDNVDEVFADLERQAKDNAGRSPEENPAGARDLTDEELRKLNESFREGLRSIEDHPWFGKKD